MENKNRSRISEFFRNEYTNLKNYVRSVLRDQIDLDAEDIIQEVAVNLFSRVDFESPIENLGAYVYRSIKNRVIDLQRNRKRKMQLQMEDLSEKSKATVKSTIDLIDDHPDPNMREYLIEKLSEAMDELNPDYRDILWATEFEGRTFQDLSNELKVPVGTLLSRKHRAIAALQKFFKTRYPGLLDDYFENNN
jgi:RNA polymerase sigma-70 factor (ECF subfamily)